MAGESHDLRRTLARKCSAVLLPLQALSALCTGLLEDRLRELHDLPTLRNVLRRLRVKPCVVCWRQDFPQSKDSSSSSSSRRSDRFDPFGSQTDQSAYWEQRAAQIQQAAQMKARRAVRTDCLCALLSRSTCWHGARTGNL